VAGEEEALGEGGESPAAAFAIAATITPNTAIPAAHPKPTNVIRAHNGFTLVSAGGVVIHDTKNMSFKNRRNCCQYADPRALHTDAEPSVLSGKVYTFLSARCILFRNA
tara:strand:+ start:9110 stop:9436 length:327 start_codon:yes stop_codon:yes gene_type:complete